jgi:hypothetical protein
MRIGMLADVYEPHVSGITNSIRFNKQVLERLGHQVFLFTFGDPETPEADPLILRSRGLPLTDSGYSLSFHYSRPARALLCLDGSLRKKMGAAAREASRKYDIQRTAQIMLAHYERLARAKSPYRHGLRYRLRTMVERWRQ